MLNHNDANVAWAEYMAIRADGSRDLSERDAFVVFLEGFAKRVAHAARAESYTDRQHMEYVAHALGFDAEDVLDDNDGDGPYIHTRSRTLEPLVRTEHAMLVALQLVLKVEQCEIAGARREIKVTEVDGPTTGAATYTAIVEHPASEHDMQIALNRAIVMCASIMGQREDLF
ncbi:hypothetical protein H1O16_gp354 [Burkholderia phage BcepSaruman]|uniref:Uncharacterized protein n=1 Tax=Burkholderia phage BcepSaruman TaxID=2530032 RepID=A0A4D5ZER3_9CAUD|nr:hypothetical protein H1O16_gp354 [Burkholderia phage BcepSaruman]QBX06767.1 hypothetical protein BcepSaruman_354 [Burkholderia phage BcepSaruman]